MTDEMMVSALDPRLYDIDRQSRLPAKEIRRLAKIEVLEELKDSSRSATYSITVESIIKIMLHELRDGN